MKIMKKLLGASALVGFMALSVSQLTAQRNVDEGKNFTVSDSPETTVFNLKVPSGNRHINDFRQAEPAAPAPVAEPAPAADDCAPGTVTDYVDKYLVRLEKTAPDMVAIDTPFDYNYTVIAKDKVKKVVVEEAIPSGHCLCFQLTRSRSKRERCYLDPLQSRKGRPYSAQPYRESHRNG